MAVWKEKPRKEMSLHAHNIAFWPGGWVVRVYICMSDAVANVCFSPWWCIGFHRGSLQVRMAVAGSFSLRYAGV